MREPDREPWFGPYPFPIIWGPLNIKGWLVLVGIMLASAVLGIIVNAHHLPRASPFH